MKRMLGPCCALALVAFSVPALVQAKPKGKAAPRKQAKASEQTKRAMGELAGKYKWGMSSSQVIDIITGNIRASYVEKLKKAGAPAEQDTIRAEMNSEINKIRDSLIKFDGQKTSWNISIVDQEFSHNNGESMLVHWEANQRRFFFFDSDRLWKQFIALNAELFEGKKFEEFSDMIAERYGTPQKVMATDSRGKESLDHLEWPSAGDYFLKAIDQVSMYGSYCLVLAQKSVMDTMEKRRRDSSTGQQRRSGADQVFRGSDSGGGDGNTDVVDSITGKQSARPKLDSVEESPPAPTPSAGEDQSAEPEPKKAAAKKKGKGKKKKK
jgi:hypothetical protein